MNLWTRILSFAKKPAPPSIKPGTFKDLFSKKELEQLHKDLENRPTKGTA